MEVNAEALAREVMDTVADAADLFWEDEDDRVNDLWKMVARDVSLHDSSRVHTALFKRFVHWRMEQGRLWTMWKCPTVGAIRIRHEDGDLILEFQALEGDLYHVKCEL